MFKMDFLYTFGIEVVNYTQQRNDSLNSFLTSLDWHNNPYNVLEYIVPWACVVDHVLGAQILYTVAFGNWASTMLKWMLAEDRPYWWVRETSFYDGVTRPALRQGPNTCETSPGSPSGHVATAATLYLLCDTWLSRVVEEMRLKEVYLDLYYCLPQKVLFTFVIMNSSIARMQSGALFPHQCLFGGMLGGLLSPIVCAGIVDPLLDETNPQNVKKLMMKNVLIAVLCGVGAAFLAAGYWLFGVDIFWGTRLAFRWCETPANISVKATPIFTVTQTVGYLLGWAISVTPEIKRFRYDAANRNNTFFIFATATVMLFFYCIELLIPNHRVLYYLLHFLLSVLKPYVYLRVLPRLSLIYPFQIHAPDYAQAANELRARRR